MALHGSLLTDSTEFYMVSIMRGNGNSKAGETTAHVLNFVPSEIVRKSLHLSETFHPKMQNLGPKTFSENSRGKI